MLLVSLVAACGGGGGGGGGNGDALEVFSISQAGPTESSTPPPPTALPEVNTPVPPPPPPPPAGTPSPFGAHPMTMTCPEGAGTHCSGSALVHDDAGIAVTSSGVQVFGASTTDLLPDNPTVTSAFGLALRDGAPAELRIGRDNIGGTTSAALLLDRLGLSWDGVTQRPRILETFSRQAGRVQIDGNGLLTFGALVGHADTGFYDYAWRGENGTQAHYANNIYFPRFDLPPRCPVGYTPCQNEESQGLATTYGAWRGGGDTPDDARASRMHEDGDVHAGDGPPDASGVPTVLPGSTDYGIPFPGSKGYRDLRHWNFAHANLAAWFTQDTINIAEWTRALAEPPPEHNKNRRGMVAFGAVTPPGNVPASGAATYRLGHVFGWYAAPWPNAGQPSDAVPFLGTADATVDFTARTLTVRISGLRSEDTGGALPIELTLNARLGDSGSNAAGYYRGVADTGAMRGALGGRLFGPVDDSPGGNAPAEIGGVFRMSDADSRAALVGGFIARKQ